AVGRIIDRGGGVVGHVGDVNHSAVNGRRTRRGEIFFVRLAAAHVVAGVDVDVPHSGEDQAVVAEGDVGRAEVLTDGDNLFPLDADLGIPLFFGTDKPAGDHHGGTAKRFRTR